MNIYYHVFDTINDLFIASCHASLCCCKSVFAHPTTINPSHPDPVQKKKNLIFIFTLFCGTSKGSVKAFIKLSEVHKKCENKNLSFFFSPRTGTGRVQIYNII